MSAERAKTPYDVLVVSCDIVGHSSVTKHQTQLRNVAGINSIVAKVIEQCDAGAVVWASGGDGGHVIFRKGTDRAKWRQSAVDLIVRLRRWSADRGVPLRVTAHAGRVTDIPGADGRVQIVGEGINAAGWLLSRGGADGVVVSEAFRRAIEQDGPLPGAEFHDPRMLRDKQRRDQLLLLMSVGADRAHWYGPADEDRTRLRQALDEKNGWEVLHYAKRILQVNKDDREALSALGKVKPSQLQYTTADGEREANPFFEYLEPSMLREVVQLAQLVQRQYNEVICRTDDAGDTMFVILRGRVGVYKRPEGADASRSVEPDYSHQEGDVVGELAFALARNRTADLVALTDTVLLSVNYEDIMKQLRDDREGRRAKEAVSSFINRRVLEHVSERVPFLLGPDKAGPLAEGDESGTEALARLKGHCELIHLPRNQMHVTFDRVTAEGSPEFRRGIYLLAGGSIKSRINSENVLSAADFPLLWADMPGFVVLPKQRFAAQGKRIKVFRIEEGGINQLDPDRRDALRTGILKASTACFEYDAFISYSRFDVEEARAWKIALQERGLRVFMDEPRYGAEFAPQINDAILHSRALVPIISSNVMIRDPVDSWVAREVEAHRESFSANRCIFPVILGEARHELIAPGVTPIKVGMDRAGAIEELATSLAALRDGTAEPPYSEKEIPELTLE